MSRTITLCLKSGATTTFFAFALIAFGPLFSPQSVALAQSEVQPNSTNEIQFPGNGQCSGTLQACIDSAPDGTTIHIASGTYTASILLNRPISLVGSDKDSTILIAEENKRVMQVAGVAVDTTVSIANLTISGGKADGSSNHDQLGGGILIEEGASPQLHDLIIQGNYARFYGGGIAIVSTEQIAIPAISIRNSIIKDNESAGIGGGLCSNADHTTIESTKISGNHAKHGGGVLVNGPFAMNDLEVTNNQADEFGGGIYGGQDAKMEAVLSTLQNSRIENNLAGYEGGGAYLFNTIIDKAHFQQNKVTIESKMSGGGGLAASSIVTVTKSVFVDNVAPDGGAVAGLGGKIWLNNSLFVDNHATDSQAGAAFSLVNASPTTRSYLTHATIVDRSDNTAAALKTGDGEIQLKNSIIVHHAIAIYNSNGRLMEQNNLYFSNTQIIEGDAIRSSGGIYADPMFQDPDSMNFHLQADSAAIDAGTNVDVMDDIDGEARPIGGAPDIGFDEAVAPVDNKQPPNPDTPPLSTQFGVYLPVVIR